MKVGIIGAGLQGKRRALSIARAGDHVTALPLAGELRGLDSAIAPLSAAGFRMTRDRSACEAVIRRRRAEVLPHLGSLSTLNPKDRAYAVGLRLTRFMVDA